MSYFDLRTFQPEVVKFTLRLEDVSTLYCFSYSWIKLNPLDSLLGTIYS